MNVELRPRLEALPTFLPVPAKADPANDNRADQATAALTAPHAAIYRAIGAKVREQLQGVIAAA